MLLVEQVRKLEKEECLVSDSSNYQSPSENKHDWTTRASKSFTTTKAGIVFVQWDTYAQNARGGGRVLNGSTPLAATGLVEIYTTTTRKVYVHLNAGSYTFNFQTACYVTGTGGFMRITNIKICFFDFNDVDKASYDSGNVSCNNAATTTVLSNQTLTTPSARKLPCGTVKKYTALILLHMANTTDRTNKVKNSGDANEAFVNWKLYVNGSQITFTEKTDDVFGTDFYSYAIGAHGYYKLALNPATNNTIRVDVYNNVGGARTCRVYAYIILCPWIIPPSAYEPIALDFPQGSTLYLTLEPLTTNPTKNSKIGKQRAISFGDSTDFYSTATGTGILTHSYTFETLQASESLLSIDGDGACVSIVAVDIR